MKKATTILLMAVLVLSVVAATSFVSAQAEDPFIRVRWEVRDDITDFEHNAENSLWVFGPQPTIVVTYAENGTDIEENDYYVDVDVDLFVNITIPKTFLGEGNSLDSVLFWGSGHLPRSPIFVLQYNVTADEWNKLCFSYQPGETEPTPSDFLALNASESTYHEYAEGYIITFAIRFVIDVGARVFWTGMQATDTEGRPVSLSWLSRVQRGDFESPPFGFQTTVDKDLFGFPEFYYAEVTNVNGEILHYVGVDDTFVFKIQANKEFGKIEIPFSILTYDEAYQINNSIVMPNDIKNPLTTWRAANLSMPFLTYVYNSTGAYALAAYLVNISWNWNMVYKVWVLSFDLQYDYSLDLSQFYVLESANVEFGGAKISWIGHFTNMTDMNDDKFSVGATITPDPFFWTVEDTEGNALNPRPEISDHNTVRLAFEDTFIDGVISINGTVVNHANPGDTVNVTLTVYGDPGKVNGSFYILVNESNAIYDGTNYYDLDGYLVHVVRDNVTIHIDGTGKGHNDTVYWSTISQHSVTVDFKNDLRYSNSTVTYYYYDADRNYIGSKTITTSSMISVDEAVMILGTSNATIRFKLTFSSDIPDMKVDDASVSTGYRVTAQANLSLAGLNSWNLWPNEPNWTEADERFDTYRDQILWTPRHFVLGEVRFWGVPKWTMTEDGAIDLDGNIFTTDDQYFVKRTGTWHDWGNTTVEGMGVGVMFDPSPGNNGDEFHSFSWMGVVDFIIQFEAHEYFYWYHADDFTPVNATELAEIQNIMWADIDNDIPQPGYEWVAWLSKNRTIDLTEVTGLDGNYWKTTWFAWGTEQAFQVSTSATSTTWAAFRAQYAGLLLFKDSPDGASRSAPDFTIEDGKVVTDEVTHVVLIDDVESLELRRPFGATNDTGDVRVSPDTEISFGISIYNVNVTMFPLQVANADGLRGPWDMYQSYEGMLGLDPTDFDSWVTHGHVTEMAFDITFNVDMVNYDPADSTTWNHAIAFKIDQKFGTWTLDEFNNTVLEDYGLAVNFFGILGTATRTEYRAGETPVTDPNSSSVNASYYQFGADNNPFANVTMGGLPYTWGGDGFSTNYTSGSSTAPIGAFSLIYENQNGESITNWDIEASMLFMTAGYDHWGGHEIRCDPVFVSYSSAYQTPTSTSPTTTISTTTTPTTTTSIPPYTPGEGPGFDTYVLIGGAILVVVILLVLSRRRR